MFFKCPDCGRATTHLDFEGWVLKARGVIELCDDSTIKIAGPVQAVTTIKRGHEFECLHSTVTCPHCNYTGHVKTFATVQTCIITGSISNITFSTPFGNIPIADTALPLAEAMLTENNMNWENTFHV